MINEPLENDAPDLLSSKLDQLIAAVLDSKISPKISLEITLWETKDVACYLKASYRYTSEFIVTHHTFPNAVRLPTKNKTKGHPRWYASEVIEWVAKHQDG